MKLILCILYGALGKWVKQIIFLPSGPSQEFTASLPSESPELQFGMYVYNGGVLKADQTLTVSGITIENEGTLSGVEHLVIGPQGVIILR